MVVRTWNGKNIIEQGITRNLLGGVNRRHDKYTCSIE